MTNNQPIDTPRSPAEPTPMPTTAKKPPRQRLVWLGSLLRNRKAVAGTLIVLFFVLTAVFAPVIAKGDPTEFVDRPHLAPSSEYVFGTEGQGKDVFAQTVWGGRITLTVGFISGLVITIIGVVVGMTAGYFRGWVDDVLSLLMNLFLVIPGLPLLGIIAAYLRPGAKTMILALAFTGWAWGARGCGRKPYPCVKKILYRRQSLVAKAAHG